MRATVMEVNIDKFNENINKIKKYVGDKEIMPIIKANAYGTYINKNVDIINKFKIVGVAIVDEAVELRKLGYKKDIFVLNQPDIDEVDDIIEYNVIVGLSSNEFLDKIIKLDKEIRIHLEIETGMNRTGIKLDNLDEFIKKIKKNKKIVVEGCYTHLSSADNDWEYTNLQLEKFRKAVEIVKNSFETIKYIHSSASNGLINYCDNVSNLVRPGIIMYGYESFENMREKIDVSSICKLKTKIIVIKNISKGDSVGYSRKFIASSDMRVATIPIGYADGLRREMSNKGEVVVNNKKVRILGNICMDSCMIDVTDIEDVRVGTDVYIWDNDIIKVEDIACKCETINYEVLSTISYRVPRIFVD